MTPLERLRYKVECLQRDGHDDRNSAIYEILGLFEIALEEEKKELRNGQQHTLFD